LTPSKSHFVIYPKEGDLGLPVLVKAENYVFLDEKIIKIAIFEFHPIFSFDFHPFDPTGKIIEEKSLIFGRTQGKFYRGGIKIKEIYSKIYLVKVL